MTSLYDRGMSMRREVLGDEHVDRSMGNVSEFARPVQEFVTEFVWGGVWNRDGLDLRTRSLLNLVMLTALNRMHEFGVHVRGAVNNGCSREQIREALLQTAAYCGAPGRPGVIPGGGARARGDRCRGVRPPVARRPRRCDAGEVAYVAPSTGRAVRAVLFDVFGTVVDWRSGIAAAVGSFAGRHGLELDSDAFADPGAASTSLRCGACARRPAFVSLDVLHRENLDDALRAWGSTRAPSRRRAGSSRAGLALPAAVAGQRSGDRGDQSGRLHRGADVQREHVAAARHGEGGRAAVGPDPRLGRVASLKPDPEAYLRPAALLALEPGEVMLAAAHPADLAAASGGPGHGVHRPAVEHGPAARRNRRR